MKQFKIIKTQGTKDSVGAFMVMDKKDQELFDKEGNNAWDTYQEAEKILNEKIHNRSKPRISGAANNHRPGAQDHGQQLDEVWS